MPTRKITIYIKKASFCYNLNSKSNLCQSDINVECFNMDVPSVPNQPKSFKFPKRSFGQKNPVQRSFQASWFSSKPWLHYDESKDLLRGRNSCFFSVCSAV